MADVRITDRFSQAIREMSEQSRVKLQQFAETMSELAKRPPPIGSPVDTGNNRDSIAVDPIGRMKFRVATQTGYGAYLEFGTVNMAARPYLSTAFEDAKRDFNSRDWT